MCVSDVDMASVCRLAITGHNSPPNARHFYKLSIRGILRDFLGTDASKNDSRWGETKEIMAKSQIEPYCVSYKKEEQKTLGLISL